MIRKIAQASALASIVLVSGCASILNDDNQTVNISASNGKELQGTVNGTPFKGPGPVSFKREKTAKTLVTETPGCARETVVDSTVDPKFFVNILSGGALGSSTDYGTGKMWKYADNVVVSCSQ